MAQKLFVKRRFQGYESSMERKFLDFSLPGVNVPRNESSTGAKVLSMVFSLPWTKVQRNEKGKSTQFVRPGKFMKVSYNDSLSD